MKIVEIEPEGMLVGATTNPDFWQSPVNCGETKDD
jgi:hypothetical protein